jgi:hypothetical protein
MADPFASSVFSLILAWVFSLPLLFYVFSYLIDAFLSRKKGIPWAMSAYIAFCIFVISPFRYMLLQILVAESYAVQSFGAFASILLLAMYVPIIFGLLYAAGMGLSLFAFIMLAGNETKPRMVIALVAMPFLCAIGYAFFFAVLPYATWTIGWLKDREVVAATNGPATFFYRFIVRPDIPRIGPQLSDTVTGPDAKSELRNHVLAMYVSNYKQARRHMLTSRDNLEYANTLLNETEGEGLLKKIPAENVEKAVAALKVAVVEARAANVEQLNKRHAGLGDAWRDKYIPALETMIKSYEEPGILISLKANSMFREWADWYNTNVATEK